MMPSHSISLGPTVSAAAFQASGLARADRRVWRAARLDCGTRRSSKIGRRCPDADLDRARRAIRSAIDVPETRREERRETLPIACLHASCNRSPDRVAAFSMRRLGRELGRELVEAGERLGVAVGVELLDASRGRRRPKTQKRGTASRRRRRSCDRCRNRQRTSNASGSRPRTSSTRLRRRRARARRAAEALEELVDASRGPKPTVRWSARIRCRARRRGSAFEVGGAVSRATERAVAAARARAGPSGSSSA